MGRFGTVGVSGGGRRLQRAFAAFVLLSLLSIWSIFIGIVVQSHKTEETVAMRSAGDVAALLGRDIARNLNVDDTVIKAVVKKVTDRAPLGSAASAEALKTEVENVPDLFQGGHIFILGKTGVVVSSSKPMPPALDLSDRDYFTIHRDGSGNGGAYISAPFQSRSRGGLWRVVLSRRLVDANGGFYGIIACSIDLGDFVDLFKTVRLPPGSSIALFNESGAILTRVTDAETQFMVSLPNADIHARFKTASEGSFIKKSLIDRFDRVFSFRKIGATSLGLIVGLAEDEVFQGWKQRMMVIGAAFFVLSGLVIGLAIFLGKELSRRTRAETALAHLASTDSLTSLSNRRRFDDALALEWKRAARANSPIALVMIDVDFFKGFNDSHGHLAGDDALVKIAAALARETQRPADLVARYGGEEFVILLPDTTLDGAVHVAERMRETVLALDLAHAESPFGVITVSVGVASTHAAGSITAASVLRAADDALYGAKSAGRNRVIKSDVDAPLVRSRAG